MKRLKRSLLSLTAAGARLLMCGAVAGAERADIVLADFEGESFGAWRIAGTAFGQAPVPQRAGGNVSAGRVASSDRRLENGKSADASLHSPDFVVPRRYLNLELAGGDHAFRAAASLWVDGRVVRTSTGGNRSRPGWVTWDLGHFEGRTAWLGLHDYCFEEPLGFVIADPIVLSDKPAAPDGGDVAAAVAQVQQEAIAAIRRNAARAAADPYRPTRACLTCAQRTGGYSSPGYTMRPARTSAWRRSPRAAAQPWFHCRPGGWRQRRSTTRD